MKVTTTHPRRRLVGWIVASAAHHLWGLLLLALLMIVEAVLLAASPWPMKIIVDHVLIDSPRPAWVRTIADVLPGAHAPRGLIAWMVAATIILFAASSLLGIMQATLSASIGQRMVYSAAAQVFAKLQRLSLAFHARRSVGDSIRRITGDCAAVATIIRDSLLPSMAALCAVVVMFTIMLRMNIILTLIAIAAVPLLAIILRTLTPVVLERGYHYAEAEAGIWTVAERTLTAVPVIQAFSAEGRAEQSIRAAYEQVLHRAQSLMWSQFGIKIASGVVTACAGAGLLYIGAREVMAERLTIGGLLVFLAYLAALYAPLTAMVHAAGSASQAAGGARRVLDLLSEPEEVADVPGAVPLSISASPRIRFDEVSFAYDDGQVVLDRINLDAAPGQTVAIVGASGAGKSTLMAMLPRLFDPKGGRILIDGRDIRDFTLRTLRERIAVLLQDTYLFPVSIAQNIAYACPGASRSQVEAAARDAGAHEFISQLPAGYDTLVGQRGATLSGGERQRIAIARALLKNAPILILDEPTSALDSDNEATIVDALDRLRSGRTTFIIAHRLSTIRLADHIVVLDRGRIVESGTHEQLLRHRGIYARLHAIQLGQVSRSAPSTTTAEIT